MGKYQFHTMSDMKVYFALHTEKGRRLWSVKQKAYELSEAYDEQDEEEEEVWNEKESDKLHEDFVRAFDEFDAAAKSWAAENASLIEWI